MLRCVSRQCSPLLVPLLTTTTTAGQGRLYHSSEQLQRDPSGDKPKPFLNSPGHKFKVDQAYALSPEETKQGRFGIPVGLGLFAFIMYFGFIREYGEKDKAIMDYLNRDISDKIPGGRMERIKQQVEEEKQVCDRKL